MALSATGTNGLICFHVFYYIGVSGGITVLNSEFHFLRRFRICALIFEGFAHPQKSVQAHRISLQALSKQSPSALKILQAHKMSPKNAKETWHSRQPRRPRVTPL